MNWMTMMADLIPPNLREWWPLRGHIVIIQCRDKLYDGKLKKLAPSGASMTLRTAEGDTMLPLDDCKLISYRIGGR
jgi:hypothetical protein